MRDIVIEVSDHVKDCVGRFCKVRQHKRVSVSILRDFPEVSALCVCRYSGLAGFQNQSTDVSLLFKLLFEHFMHV